MESLGPQRMDSTIYDSPLVRPPGRMSVLPLQWQIPGSQTCGKIQIVYNLMLLRLFLPYTYRHWWYNSPTLTLCGKGLFPGGLVQYPMVSATVEVDVGAIRGGQTNTKRALH